MKRWNIAVCMTLLCSAIVLKVSAPPGPKSCPITKRGPGCAPVTDPGAPYREFEAERKSAIDPLKARNAYLGWLQRSPKYTHELKKWIDQFTLYQRSLVTK